MQNKNYILQLFSCMFLMLLLVGFFQSWNLALSIFNLCIISAIMSLGINIQWGNAGIVNFGVMGFAALGGLANVIISMPPTHKAWELGGILILSGIVIFIISIFSSIYLWKKLNIAKKKKLYEHKNEKVFNVFFIHNSLISKIKKNIKIKLIDDNY